MIKFVGMVVVAFIIGTLIGLAQQETAKIPTEQIEPVRKRIVEVPHSGGGVCATLVTTTNSGSGISVYTPCSNTTMGTSTTTGTEIK